MADTFDGFPILRDFNFVPGEDWSRTFTYKTSGMPVDLTGWTGKFIIFDDYENIVANVSSVTLTSAGLITPIISHAVTSTLDAKAYRYILWIVDGSANRTPFSSGAFNGRKAIYA